MFRFERNTEHLFFQNGILPQAVTTYFYTVLIVKAFRIEINPNCGKLSVQNKVPMINNTGEDFHEWPAVHR